MNQEEWKGGEKGKTGKLGEKKGRHFNSRTGWWPCVIVSWFHPHEVQARL